MKTAAINHSATSPRDAPLAIRKHGAQHASIGYCEHLSQCVRVCSFPFALQQLHCMAWVTESVKHSYPRARGCAVSSSSDSRKPGGRLMGCRLTAFSETQRLLSPVVK